MDVSRRILEISRTTYSRCMIPVELQLDVAQTGLQYHRVVSRHGQVRLDRRPNREQLTRLKPLDVNVISQIGRGLVSIFLSVLWLNREFGADDLQDYPSDDMILFHNCLSSFALSRVLTI
jgi:hypothetical protein